MNDEKWYFRFFEKLSDAYIKRHLEAGAEKYDIKKYSNPLNSLKFFFRYAFERQGVSPYYSPVALKIVGGVDISDKSLSEKVWRKFKRELKDWLHSEKGEDPKDVKFNEMNNPLAPMGIPYKRGKKNKSTTQPSAIEFVQQLDYHDIVGFARRKLENDDAREAQRGISSINGIGVKIAGLFLRDIAILYDIKITKNWHLLQPIDTWVRRAINNFREARNDEDRAKKIVEISDKNQVDPNRVNCGMWYLGKEIAVNYYSFKRLLKSRKRVMNETQQHLKALKRVGEVDVSSLLSQDVQMH